MLASARFLTASARHRCHSEREGTETPATTIQANRPAAEMPLRRFDLGKTKATQDRAALISLCSLRQRCSKILSGGHHFGKRTAKLNLRLFFLIDEVSAESKLLVS